MNLKMQGRLSFNIVWETRKILDERYLALRRLFMHPRTFLFKECKFPVWFARAYTLKAVKHAAWTGLVKSENPQASAGG